MLATLGSQTTDRRPNEKLGQHHGARRRRTLSLRQQQPLHSTNIVRRKPHKTWHLTMTTWMAFKRTFKPHLGPGLCQELCCTSRCKQCKPRTAARLLRCPADPPDEEALPNRFGGIWRWKFLWQSCGNTQFG